MQTDATPSGVLCMRYETLREHTERERQRLYEFLDLDPSLAHPVSREQYTAPGFEAENTLSFTRKGEVGDWRNYFTDEAKRWFGEIAGESLVRAGYASDAQWSESEREAPIVTAGLAAAAMQDKFTHETHTHTS
jgi:hypothetical protein